MDTQSPIESSQVTNEDFVVRTNDFTIYPDIQVVISGKMAKLDHGACLYLAEQQTGKRIQLQTTPFHHANGVVKKYGRFAIPVQRQMEPDLYTRLRSLEHKAQTAAVYHLSTSEADDNIYRPEAQQVVAAWELYHQFDNQHPNCVKYGQPMKSAYNASETVWLRLSEKVQVFGPDNQLIAGDVDSICKRGRYELLIRASTVYLDRPQTNSDGVQQWASLLLRVTQIRYQPGPPKQLDKSLFLPPLEHQQPQVVPTECNSNQCYNLSMDELNAGAAPSPLEINDIIDWDAIIRNAAPTFLSPPRPVSPKTPPTDGCQSPLPTCAPLCDLSSDSQETIIDPWPGAIPLPKSKLPKKGPINRKRKQPAENPVFE